MDPLLKNTDLSNEDKRLLDSCCYFTKDTQTLFEKGKLKLKNSNNNGYKYSQIKYVLGCCQTRDNNYRSEIIDNEHWSIREIYPLEYYGKEYDPQTDYYKEIMMMDDPKKIQTKINNHKKKMTQIQYNMDNCKRALTYEEKRLKKEESEIEKLQLILDVNTRYKKQ
ncbi:MAG: hypothetical protein WD512_18855, partial [Candidatus Paceibacterota bacterium]